MDPFTQNLINRTKQRNEQLKAKMGYQGLSKTLGDLPSTPAKTAPLREEVTLMSKAVLVSDKENGVKEDTDGGLEENFSFAPPLTSTRCSTGRRINSPLRTHLETRPIAKPDTKDVSPLKDSRKARLATLAHSINDWEDESNISSKSASSTPVKAKKDPTTPAKYGSSAAASPARRDIYSAKKPEPAMIAASESQVDGNCTSSARKDTQRASPVVQSQGFTPTASRSRLIYEFEKERSEELSEETASSWTYAEGSPQKESPRKSLPTKKESSPRKSLPTKKVTESPRKLEPVKSAAALPVIDKTAPKTSSAAKVSAIPAKPAKPAKPSLAPTPDICDNGPAVSVLRRAAQFDTPRPPPKDLSELSLMERKALFEKNKGQPPTPSTPHHQRGFSTLTPAATRNLNSRPEQTLSAQQNANLVKAQRMKELEELRRRHEPRKMASQSPQLPSVVATSPKKQVTATKGCSPAPVRNSPAGTPVTMNSAVARRTSTDSYPGLEEVKPIKVSPAKPGKLYPCLSDIEMTTENDESSSSSAAGDDEEEEEKVDDEHGSAADESRNSQLDASQDMDSSFTVEILGRTGLNQFINTPKRKLQELQQSMQQQRQNATLPQQQQRDSDDDSDDIGDISDLLNEALEDHESTSVTPPKQKRRSEGLQVMPDDGDQIPLYHSISSYRKQQTAAASAVATPVKQVVVRNPQVAVRAASSSVDEGAPAQRAPVQQVQVNVHQQIRNLQEEINAQQIVMAQASQALNLCRATAEFSGSTEQVEGERLLLVASQKRHTAMNEIQRLKTQAALKQGAESAGGVVASRGTLSISNLALPLKKDFINMLARGGDDFVHYFLVLIRTRGQVIPTQMVSTLDGVQDGALRFPNLIQLRELSTDFQVSVEVYALQTRKEKLAHEDKYHIRKDTSKMRLTPKKLLNKQESRLLSTPTISSPAGPTAVRSSSFGLVGSTQMTAATLRRKQWTLDKVPFASPIDGTLALKVQCHTESVVEERGFLTVFEDVAGFGAWHRRWSVLCNDRILFWKYPDDEKRKDPLGEINLRTCVTESVDLVARDVCARPNTFLLVTVRPVQKTDKNSLVMTCYNHRTALRHLLSADLKEERQLWCSQINFALANLRAWDPDAQEPSMEGAAFQKDSTC